MMDRLQKKCFIATTACHSALVGVLLFGAALMPKKSDDVSVPILIAIDPTTVSDALTHGGEANVAPPPAPAPNPPIKAPETVPPPTPKTTPPPAKPPSPHVEPPKNVRNDVPKVQPDKTPTARPKDIAPPTIKPPPHKPLLDAADLRPSKRTTDETANAASAAAAAAAKAKNRQIEKQIAMGLTTLKKDLSSTTLVRATPGVGTSGEASVNYNDLIFNKYYHAWIFPPGADEDTPSVTVTVTIARDGSVKSARIVKKSGNSFMDKSVQNVLENVTYIQAFPDSFTEQERTVTIEFDPRAKRQTG